MEPEVDPALRVELLMLSVGIFELDSILLLGLSVVGLPNFAEGT